MSDKGLMRIGGKSEDDAKKKMVVEASEGGVEAKVEEKEAGKAEKSSEQLKEKTLDALQQSKRDYEARIAEAFALETFHQNGGQELVQIFGIDRVFDAMDEFRKAEEKRPKGRGGKIPNLLDLVKALEPDSAEREIVYSQMEKRANEFKARIDDGEAQFGSYTEDPAHPVRALHSRFKSIYGDGVGNETRLKQFAIGSLRSADSILGKVFLSKDDASTLSFGIRPLLGEAYNGNLERLKAELTKSGRGDFMVTVHDMREEAEKAGAERIKQAIELHQSCDQEIQVITRELETKLAEDVSKALLDLQAATEKNQDTDFGRKVSLGMAETVQKEILAAQEATRKEIEQKTATLSAIRDRAAQLTSRY